MQLNLFEHAPRDYHESLRCLGRLDLDGCREALDRHRRTARAGPDPEPVECAARWLEGELPHPQRTPEAYGREALRVCLTLRGAVDRADAPPLLGPTADLAGKVVKQVARRALAVAAESATVDSLLDRGLPWCVFQLFADRFWEARRSLLAFLRREGPTAPACLALGEACLRLGRGDEALCGWREGFGLDPAGRGWAPVPEWTAGLREQYARDPEFGGGWWAVGAYLDGHFPRYTPAPPALVVQRWQRFLREEETADSLPPPARFFAGLFLSEQSAELPAKDLARVRRTLAALHSDAYQRHRDQLEEGASNPRSVGTEMFAW